MIKIWTTDSVTYSLCELPIQAPPSCALLLKFFICYFVHECFLTERISEHLLLHLPPLSCVNWWPGTTSWHYQLVKLSSGLSTPLNGGGGGMIEKRKAIIYPHTLGSWCGLVLYLVCSGYFISYCLDHSYSWWAKNTKTCAKRASIRCRGKTCH